MGMAFACEHAAEIMLSQSLLSEGAGEITSHLSLVGLNPISGFLETRTSSSKAKAGLVLS